MAYTYLEFEKPISDLENKIENLRDSKDNDESCLLYTSPSPRDP